MFGTKSEKSWNGNGKEWTSIEFKKGIMSNEMYLRKRKLAKRELSWAGNQREKLKTHFRPV